MLGGFITKEECAECRQCCKFERCDLLLTPLITPEVRELILEKYLPGEQFIHREGCFLLRFDLEGGDSLDCPLLTERGCVMGDEKPFECRIWPLRVMDRDGEPVITLSPECPAAAGKPIELARETARRLAPVIFGEAREHPELVKPYDRGCEILFYEGDE